MKLRGLLFLCFLIILSSPALGSEIVYDGFENGLNNWNNFSWIQASGGSNGSYYAQCGPSIALGLLNRSQGTAYYQNINVSFWAASNGMDANENTSLQWYNGTSWITIWSQEDITEWTYFSFLLPSGATNNSNFAINFKCDGPDSTEYGAIDDVRITGSVIPGILNVTNYAPAGELTVTHTEPFLINATITCIGGYCGNVNASLRYNKTSNIAPDTLMGIYEGDTPFYTYNYSSYLPWFSNGTLISELGGINYYSRPAIAYNVTGNGKWVIISGNFTGNFTGWYLESGGWVKNSSLVAGLETFGSYKSAPAMAQIGNRWNLISGEYYGGFVGWTWNGINWTSNSTLVSGLNSAFSESAPTMAYNMTGDNRWVLIVGNYSGNFTGYYWNGNSWVLNSSLISGLDNSEISASPVIAHMGGAWNLISGEYNDGIEGWTWGGTGWITNSTLADEFNAVGNRVTPAMAYNLDGNDKWALVLGNADGLFFKYYWDGEDWIPHNTLVRGLEDTDSNSAPTIVYDFNDNNKWVLFSLNSTDRLIGFYWDDGMWVKDSALTSGNPYTGSEGVLAIVYNLTGDGKWVLISGSWSGDFDGWVWNGTSWNTNTSLITGLGDVGEDSSPAIVYNLMNDGRWVLISGERYGAFFGYYWNESSWVPDNSSVTGLEDIGLDSAPTLAYNVMGNRKWALISGAYSGEFYGYSWNGSRWLSNGTLTGGLVAIESDSHLTLAQVGNRWNLISGNTYGTYHAWTLSKHSRQNLEVGDQSYFVSWLIRATGAGKYIANITFDSEYYTNSTPNFFITINDNTLPNIRGLWRNVSNMSVYSPIQGYQFNATVTDIGALDRVWIEHNFTGTLANYSAANESFSKYHYNAGILSAGFYRYRWWANDTSKNINGSEIVYYKIQNPGLINITVQYPVAGSSQNVEQNASFYVNATIICLGGGCGTVNATIKYNVTALSPNEPVGKIIGTLPFYTITDNEIVIGMDPTENEVRMYSNMSGGWVETNISDEPTYVNTHALGDADNDGKNEIVIGLSTITNEIRMYKYAYNGWIETNISDLSEMIWSNIIGDANNDGKQDVVIGTASGTNELRLYENKSGGWVETNISNTPTSVYAVDVGDANNDGKNEILVGLSSTANETRMYENKSGGWIETNISDNTTVDSIAVGDADNDGLNEVVIGMANSVYELRIYKNMSGGWAETKIGEISSGIRSVDVGDADNDGQNEIVIGATNSTDESYEVKIYKNASGGWTETNVANMPATVSSVDIGDADNDGLNEVVIGMNTTAYEVRMYANESGGWAETNISDVPIWVNFALIGDVDTDKENPIDCGYLNENDVCVVQWWINATGAQSSRYWLDINFSSDLAVVLANDSGNFQINIAEDALGTLTAELVTPTATLSTLKFRFFNVTARVSCSGSRCGLVNGTLYYNLTTVLPGTVLNTTTGDRPFYTNNSNPYECGNMNSGQSCDASWLANATGDFLTEWLLKATFNSNESSIDQASSSNFKVTIDPILYCSSYTSCAYPECLYYSDRITDIATVDYSQRVWSRVRKCWT